MENNILLSIVIPAFNVSPFLAKCLDSILINDSTNFEIVLVDDGSTDDTGIICDDYAKRFSSIKTYHKTNGGLSDARNYGIEKSNGRYLMFVDSDDYLETGAIKYFLKKINEFNADVYIAKSHYVNFKGIIKDEVRYSIKEGLYSLKEFLKTQNKNPKSNIFAAQYFICKKDVVQNNHLRFKKGIIHEDELWTPNLLLRSKTIYYCDFYFYYHIERSGSIMSSYQTVKSGSSLLYVCTELDKLYRTSKQPLRYAKDHLSVMYLQAFTKLGIGAKKSIYKRILLRNSRFFKTKIKTLLYILGPRIYLKLWSEKYDIS